MWPFGRGSGLTSGRRVVIDPAMGDPLAARLISASRQGDWRTIRELLANVDHPDDHLFYVTVTTNVDGVEQWVDEWVAAVRADLRAAADRSVRHPDYPRRPGWPLSHNVFAMTFSFAEDWPEAAEQFNAIGGLMTDFPWYYLPFPKWRFRKCRSLARAAHAG